MSGSGADPGALAAVVVNYNAGDALIACVASLRAGGIVEIVVVDNASSDGSLERLAGLDAAVTLVPSGANLGYGTAANLGVRRCSSPYVLVSNPDLVVAPGAPGRLVEVLEAAADVAAAGPRVLEPDGAVYPSARAFPSLRDAIGHAVVGLVRPDNPWTRRYRLAERSAAAGESDTVESDWVSGSCIALRRAAFDSVGGFDERYFMYVEDLDLCWRLRRAGWRVVYAPGAVVTHHQGLSASRHPYRMLAAHHRSTLRFARRSMDGPDAVLVPFVALGLAGRLAAAVARRLVLRARPARDRPSPGVE